jgi:hypothetical protein
VKFYVLKLYLATRCSLHMPAFTMEHWSEKVPKGPKARRSESRGPARSRRSADYNDGYDSYTPSSKTWKASDERPRTPGSAKRRTTDDEPWNKQQSPKNSVSPGSLLSSAMLILPFVEPQ